MAVGEQPGQRLPDEVALADDDPADLALDRLGALGERLGARSWAARRRRSVVDAFIGSSGSVSAAPVGHVRRVQRAEVVADEVLDRQRHVVPVEASSARSRRSRRRPAGTACSAPLFVALAGLVALLGLAVAAGPRDVRRVAGLAERGRTARRRRRGPRRGRPAGSGWSARPAGRRRWCPGRGGGRSSRRHRCAPCPGPDLGPDPGPGPALALPWP